MPEISVVIPAYNAEKYIAQTLESVLNQTYQDFEIIVVDDDSTDSTVKIINEYINNFPDKIKYIYQENKGPAGARNTGIRKANGNYIAFLDSDDVWLPNKIEKQIAILNKDKNIGLVCTGRIRIDQKTQSKTIDSKGGKLTNDKYLDLWQVGNFITTSSVLLRKECFNTSGLFDESNNVTGSEDWDMWLRIAELHKIEYINEPLVEYKVRLDGHCRSHYNRSRESGICVIRKHQNKLKERYKNHKNILIDIWAGYYFNYGITLFYLDRIKDSHDKFKKSLKHWPINLKALFYFFITFLDASVIKKLKTFKKYFKK